jgi:hypothetical protein
VLTTVGKLAIGSVAVLTTLVGGVAASLGNQWPGTDPDTSGHGSADHHHANAKLERIQSRTGGTDADNSGTDHRDTATGRTATATGCPASEPATTGQAQTSTGTVTTTRTTRDVLQELCRSMGGRRGTVVP